MSQTHLPEKWIERTRALLEIPNTHDRYRFFEAWQRAEGGNAKWNPLNTTIAIAGTTNWTEADDYNNIPVRNYKYAIVGIVAIALTFAQHESDGSLRYGTLLKNLRNGSLTAEQVVQQSEADIRKWGTSPELMLQLLEEIS